ncbi:hypothetical protein NDI53_12670 [Leptolyngbya sp. NM3-A1]
MTLLVSILVPSWLGLMTGQTLNHAQDGVFQTMRAAQVQAKTNHAAWQASFRDTPQGIQAAAHPVNAEPTQIPWETLSSGAQIDAAMTTLLQTAGTYQIRFTAQGGVSGQMGRMTLRRGDRTSRRCVFSSSLLGALRTARNEECNRNLQ